MKTSTAVWLLVGVLFGVVWVSVATACYLQERASHEIRIEFR